MSTKKKSEFWNVGEKYFIRTVTHYLTGKLVEISDKDVVLTDAAWIADTGRFSNAMSGGEFSEVEPYPDGQLVLVNRDSVIDATIWTKDLPRKQK